MIRIPHVPLPVALGLILLVSGVGMYGYGWYLDTTHECPNGVSIDHVEEPSSTDATNFSTLTTDQQGVFLLGLDEGSVGSISTPDDEIMDIASSLPRRVTYDGATYEVGHYAVLCDPGVLPATAGLVTIVASLLVFVVGGTISVVLRRRT